MIVGRRTRKWWQKLPEEQKDRFRAKRENHGKILGFSSVILTAFVAFGYQSHLEECQLTGRKKFIALKKNQVEKIAESESENVSFVNFFSNFFLNFYFNFRFFWFIFELLSNFRFFFNFFLCNPFIFYNLIMILF